MDTTTGSVVVHPHGPHGADLETEASFHEPGTGLLMIRPWGSSSLAMMIAGLDAQGMETASRLFPKRTGLLVPDWSMHLIFVLILSRCLRVVCVKTS